MRDPHHPPRIEGFGRRPVPRRCLAGRRARAPEVSSVTIRTAEEYIASLRDRRLRVYLFGELVPEPVDHPLIRPSINAVAETYRLAEEDPDLATASSSLSNTKVNR